MSATGGMPDATDRRGGVGTSRTWELAGIGLWVATAAWLGWRATAVHRPAVVAWTAGLGLLVLGVRRLGATRRALGTAILVALAGAAIAVAVLAATGPSGLTAASGEPIAYANARAAFFALGGGAAMVVAVRATSRVVTGVAVAVALGLLALPWVLESLGAAAGTLLVLGGAVVTRWPWGRRLVPVAAVLVVTLALVATTVLGLIWSTTHRSPLPAAVTETLSERRLLLWAEALDMATTHPLGGVGLGEFADLSPTAQSDQDVDHAHNEPLQIAAEAGIPGVLLGAALVGWMGIGLARGPGSRGQLVAMLALAGLVVQSSMDYVLHAPAVLVGAAVLAGTSGTPVRDPVE